MEIFIITSLWLLAGYIPYKIISYSWEGGWYESFGEHYRDDKSFYNSTEEFLSIVLFSLGGLCTLVIVPLAAKTFSPDSKYYYKKGLGMVFRYNRKKVEQHYTIVKEEEDITDKDLMS